jgi:histidyl-tRNA synthetase
MERQRFVDLDEGKGRRACVLGKDGVERGSDDSRDSCLADCPDRAIVPCSPPEASRSQDVAALDPRRKLRIHRSEELRAGLSRSGAACGVGYDAGGGHVEAEGPDLPGQDGAGVAAGDFGHALPLTFGLPVFILQAVEHPPADHVAVPAGGPNGCGSRGAWYLRAVMSISAVKGFRDGLGPAAQMSREIEEAASGVLESYGFQEVRLPILERTELFARAIGEATDIVEKEMYTFEDRDGSLITLRPEGTASVVRALVEHHLDQKDSIVRLYYSGPMFRHERPQKGRHRQFYQIGCEYFGREDPLADAEILVCVRDILDAVGIPEARLLVNSLGDEACRPAYREVLRAWAEDRKESLCGNCVRRLEKNPLRVLDCKVAGCQEATADAPLLRDHLCGDCSQHFERVLQFLDDLGVSYEVAPRLVRGLDYYVRTTFEITAEGLGSQSAVGAGGRYDGLVAQLGGPKMSGIGFAFGVDRLALAREAALPGAEERAGEKLKPAVFIVALGSAAEAASLGLARKLRAQGVRVELDGGRSLKSLMRRADKLGAPRVLIVGEEEVAAGRGTLRDMVAKRDEKLAVDFGLEGEALLAVLGVDV